jgi:hypothetical protein
VVLEQVSPSRADGTQTPQASSPPQDSDSHCELNAQAPPSGTVPGVTHAGSCCRARWLMGKQAA